MSIPAPRAVEALRHMVDGVGNQIDKAITEHARWSLEGATRAITTHLLEDDNEGLGQFTRDELAHLLAVALLTLALGTKDSPRNALMAP